MDVRSRIALLVQAQGASKAKRDIEGVGKATGNLGNKTKTSGKSMGTARSAASAFGASLRGLARWAKYGAVAVGGLALVLGKRSIDEWREAGRVNRVTAARIKSTGKAAGLSADQVGDMSTSLSNLVGIDDEEIQGTANRLLTFTKIKGDLFKPALKAATDMGAEFGDAGSKAVMLGKALQDPVKGATALRRAGVNLNQQQQDQLTTWVEQGDTIKAQRWILRELNREFGGTAKAQTDGLQRMSVSWKNVEESIGGVFGPALDFAGNKFADFADKKVIPFIDSIAAEMRGIWGPNNDDDLQQRLDRTGNVLRNRLGPVWSDLKHDIDQADLGDKLADAFSDAFPVIAETAGRGGGRATLAFIKGWWHSAWWAKLLTFAFVAGKLGALTPLGKWAGKKFVSAMAPRVAAMLGVEMAAEGAVGSAVVRKMKPLGRVSGMAFGAAMIATAPLWVPQLSGLVNSLLEDLVPGYKDANDLGSGPSGDSKPTEGASLPGKTPGYGPVIIKDPPKLKPPGKLPRHQRSLDRDIVLDNTIEVDGEVLGRNQRRVALRELLKEAVD